MRSTSGTCRTLVTKCHHPNFAAPWDLFALLPFSSVWQVAPVPRTSLHAKVSKINLGAQMRSVLKSSEYSMHAICLVPLGFRLHLKENTTTDQSFSRINSRPHILVVLVAWARNYAKTAVLTQVKCSNFLDALRYSMAASDSHLKKHSAGSTHNIQNILRIYLFMGACRHRYSAEILLYMAQPKPQQPQRSWQVCLPPQNVKVAAWALFCVDLRGSSAAPSGTS